ncbi:MAG: CDP-alcohol phosphatidyltransferase family protein [Kofleriaceae bacterium]
MPERVAFVEVGPAGGHRLVAGGLTVLERRVRELAKAGATRVVVAAEPVDFGRPLPVEVEFVGAGAAAPDDAERARGDVLAGVEVVDVASCKRAEWAVLRSMNKSFEGPVDALINWRVSMRITRQLAKTRLTPNHVTLVAITVGVVASLLLLLRGDRLALAVAGVLLQLNSILDSCDGELARLRFQYSKLGQWLDNLSDDLVDNLFIASAGLMLGGVWAVLGVAAAGGRLFASVVIYVLVYRRTGTGDVFAFRYWFESVDDTPDQIYDPTSILTWIRAMGRRDTYVFTWMVVCLVGFAPWVVGHGLAISAVAVAMILAHLWKIRGQAATT